MGVSESIKGVYFSFEDRYYGFLDWLEGHGIPIYSVVDPVESAGVPSFPILALLVLLIVGVVGVTVLGGFFPGSGTLGVLVTDAQGQPIENAVVSVTVGESTNNFPTNSSGKVEKTFPMGTEVSLNVSKDGFQSKSVPGFKIQKVQEDKTVLLEPAVVTLTKIVNLVDATGALYTKPITIAFSCMNNAAFSTTSSSQSGVITVNEIPQNCGLLKATSLTTGISFEEGMINLSAVGAASLQVSAAQQGSGTVRVTVKNERNEFVPGANVKLYRSDLGTQFSSRTSNANGTTEFQQVPVGSYYIIVTYAIGDQYGEFNSGVSDDGIKTVTPNGTTEFVAVLKQIPVGKIRLAVSDVSAAKPVSNAKVTVLKNNVEQDSGSTAEDGSIEFKVGESGPVYSVVVDHPAYLIKTLNNLAPSDSVVPVALQLAGIQSTTLEVSVVDPAGLAVENAVVQLKKQSDGSVVSSQLATGVDGKVTFTRLVADTYFAVVSKEGFESVTSQPVTVQDRTANALTVTLNIGFGNMVLLVMDDAQQPIASAKIQMIDAFSTELLQEGLSGADGTQSFSVRADKTVFFRISSNDFLPFTTVVYTAPVNSTRSVSIQLVKDISKLEVVFEGLFVNDAAVTDSLAAGQRYTAKLLLLVPPGVDWDEAGLFVRTGAFDDGKTNLMESDYLLLGKASSAASSVLRGKSFSPPNNFAEDARHITTANSKWLQATFGKPESGAYELQVQVQVLDAAPVGTLLPFSYRAFGKSAASVVRFPVDQVLGSSESTALKQGLYAKTNDHFFTQGPTTLCNDQFCYLFVIQDVAQQQRLTVVDEYPAKVSSQYKLLFTIVSKATSFSNAALEIANDESGLLFGDYKITDAQGRVFSGKAVNASALSQSISDVGKDGSIFGELSFFTQKEGSNALRIGLKSNQESVFSKTILVKTAAVADLNFDVLPKTLVPLLDNDVLVKASDKNSGRPIADLTVDVFVNDAPVVSGKTDAQGIFHYALASPAPGWIVKLVGHKTGYAMVTKELKVSNNVLSVIPDSVNESLTVTGLFGFEKDFIVSNFSSARVSISNVAVSSELTGLLNISVEDGVKGRVLNPGTDTNFSVRVELTDKAKALREPVQLKGTFTIYTTLDEFQKSFANVIPFNVFIGFGNEVDSTDCLTLSPNDWKIFTGTADNQVLTIKLTNKCRADKAFVVLHDVQMRIQPVGTDNLLGGFVVSSDLPGGKTVGLGTEFQSVAPEIPANVDPTLTLTFAPHPAIRGGRAKAKLLVRAMHTTANGPQPIDATVTIDSTVNNLAACIQVTPVNLILYSTPPGIGNGIYSSYGYDQGQTYGGAPSKYGGAGSGFGRMDYPGASNLYFNTMQNNTQSIGGNPTVVGYPEQLYANNYPFAGYSEPFYDTLAPFANNGAIPGYAGYRGNSAAQYGGLFGNFNYQNASYGRNNQFRVANNCSAPIEVSFDADPALLVNTSSLVIEADKQQAVPLESAYYYGLYPLNVRARLKDSQEPSQIIQTVHVNVLPANDPTQYDNCIRLSTTSFKFNDFIQKPVTAKVYNSCYGQGVRLDYDSISFTNQGYGEQLARKEGSPGIIESVEPVNLVSVPQSGGTGTQVLEFEIFKNLNYRPQLAGGAFGAGGPEEINGFRTFATGAYNRVQARAQLVVRFSSPQGMEQRKVFRVIVEDFWNLFGSFPPIFNGNPYAKPEDCLIVNALDYGVCVSEDDFAGKNSYSASVRQVLRIGPNPYGESVRTLYGNPAVNTRSAPNQGPGGTAFSTGTMHDQLYQPTYAPTSYPQPYPYYAPNYSAGPNPYATSGNLPPEVRNVCGTLDSVTLKTQAVTKNGIKFTFSNNAGENKTGPQAGNSGVKLTIDKSGAAGIGETKLDTTIEVQVFRQSAFGTTVLKVPVNVCVTIGKIDQNRLPPGSQPPLLVPAPVPDQTTPIAEVCQTNYSPNKMSTGNDTYKKVFGRLLLNWELDLGISDTKGEACDNQYYCDAVQDTLGLVKKSKAIWEALNAEPLASAWKSNQEKVAAAVGNADVKSFENTKNLVRWFKKQSLIEDNAKLSAGNEFEAVAAGNGEKLVFFFAASDPSQLLSMGSIDNAEYSADLAQFNSETDPVKKLDAMSGLLRKLSKATQLTSDGTPIALDAKGIVLTMNSEKFLATELDVLAKLGSQKAEEQSKTLVMTLNEFGYLHQEIKKCALANPSATECLVNGTTVSLSLLNNLVNSDLTVQVIARHTADLDKPTGYYETLQDLAAWTKGTEEKAGELAKLTRIKANLMPDNYSAQFKKDFAQYYSTGTHGTKDLEKVVKNVEKWSFSPAQIQTAGTYQGVLNYSWATNSTDVSFSPTGKNKPLPVLFSVPFDASLQEIESGSKDYGMALSGSDTEKFVLLQGKEDSLLALPDGKNSLSFHFVNELANDAIKKGRLLVLTKDSLEFSPTTPFAFKMNLPGSNNGVLFKFEDSSFEKTIQWNKIESTGTENQICQNGKGDTAFGLLSQNAKGLFFLPDKTTSAVFSLVCANQSASVDVSRHSPFSDSANATGSANASKNSGNSVTLNAGKDPNKTMTLQSLAKAVKNGQVCVRTAEDSLELAWNPLFVLPN